MYGRGRVIAIFAHCFAPYARASVSAYITPTVSQSVLLFVNIRAGRVNVRARMPSPTWSSVLL